MTRTTRMLLMLIGLTSAAGVLAEGDAAAGKLKTEACAGCHGADLGGQMFNGEAPVWAPNLTNHATGLAGWSQGDFETGLQRGLRPDGRSLDAASMPWPGFAGLHPEEVSAIWSHLRALPPVDRADPNAS